MASEIQLAHDTTAETLYAIIRNSVGQVWQTTTSTFVSYATANLGNYDIALAEQGTGSLYYVGDFPAAAAGVYNVSVYVRAGGAPAEGDAIAGAGAIEWDGTAVVTLYSRLAASETRNVAFQAGINITQSSSNTAAMIVTGNGSGAGGLFTGGLTGCGIMGVGGATSGDGIYGIGGASGHGIHAIGIGGSGANDGIHATGGTDAFGILGEGTGIGHGIGGYSGSGATGDGIIGRAMSTNGNGMSFVHTGSGKDLNATTTALVVAGVAGTTQTFDALQTALNSTHGAGSWATATGFSTHTAGDVWSVVTRVLTAGTNIVLAKGVGVTGFNDLSAAQVNTEADTALADYDAPTNAEMVARTIASASYATATNQTNIEADTQDIQSRLPAALTGAGNMKSDTLAINGSTSAAAKQALAAAGVISGSCTSTGTTTTIIDTSLTQVDDFWIGRVVIFLTGTLAGQATVISDFTASSDTLTVVALTSAPQSGDTYIIV